MTSNTSRRPALPFLLLSIALAGSAQAVPHEGGAASPHLAGSWSWTDPQQCSETYEYAADGSGKVSSGAEKSEMAYIFDPIPVEDGFYRLEATITRDYGGRDCAGSDSNDTNQRYTVYLKFHPDGNQHIVCMEPALRHCFGPLKRSSPGRGI